MQKEHAETLINIHSARGEFYAFFCRIFANVPDNDFYEMLAEISYKIEQISKYTNNDDIKSGANGISAFIDKRNTLKGKELTDFDIETARNYTTLFCLTKSIPTDESIYTSHEHREKQLAYDQMKALFKKYGFEKTNKIPENEDFISYELIFMSKLAYASAELIEKNDIETYNKYIEEQHLFHTKHFDKWIYEFLKRVIHSDIEEERFYKYLSLFAGGFILEDRKTMAELAESAEKQ